MMKVDCRSGTPLLIRDRSRSSKSIDLDAGELQKRPSLVLRAKWKSSATRKHTEFETSWHYSAGMAWNIPEPG